LKDGEQPRLRESKNKYNLRTRNVMSINTSSLNTTPRSLQLAAVFIAYFTAFFVTNSLNIAMPRIVADMNGMAYYSWAISIPALATAIATLIFGKLSDMYGRRNILLAAAGFVFIGAVLSAVSQTFVMLILTLSLLSLGQGVLPPLCFSVLGDLYTAADRGVWAGLMNVPSAMAAFIVPTLSGWIVDTVGWRYIFWLDAPLALFTAVIVMIALPTFTRRQTHSIDVRGSILLAVAASTMILALSWAGSTYAWGSVQILGLLSISAVFWVLFFFAETRHSEPLFDPHHLRNRTLVTASLAAVMSTFGITTIVVYFPLFLQGVLGLSATASGKILTPFSLLLAVMGIPAGLLIARTKRYKWMYLLGYAILTITMVGLVVFQSMMTAKMGFLVTILFGLGLGAIPTINALVVQYSVPRKMLGAATGGLYFIIAMGKSFAPAILGSAMNMVYARQLSSSLSPALIGLLDTTTLHSFTNPRILLSAQALSDLREVFNQAGGQALIFYEHTVETIRASLSSALHVVFLISAVAMLIAFLMILTIKEISFDNRPRE
jgi:MFS family permease